MSTFLAPIFTVPVTRIHPGVVGDVVPHLTMQGRSNVPVILRGALQRVFKGRVTERMTFRLIPSNFTLVTHRVRDTVLWVIGLSLPLMVVPKRIVTTLTVPSLNTLDTVYVFGATQSLTVRASVLTLAVVANFPGTEHTSLGLITVIVGTLPGLI